MNKFKHFTWHQRLELYKYLYVYKISKKEIAKRLGFHISNIYREIERGMCESLDTNYKTIKMYSPDIAQKNYEKNREKCGRKYKLEKGCFSLASYESIILKKDFSPRACLVYVSKNYNIYKNIVIISYSTIYRYIYKKRFFYLTMRNLAYYRNRHKYMHISRQKRASVGTSIEYRDKEILLRYEFGHWEMDTLEGTTKCNKAIINLTERKTRQCLLFIVNKKDPKDVVKCLNLLETKYKKDFSNIFKTITVDNGVEFSDYTQMEQSICFKSKRTIIYYCHAYSPHERGTNENLNRMLRRKIKKGSNIDCITEKQLDYVNHWINSYPRKILSWKTSQELFDEEINKIKKNQKNKANFQI